MTKLYTISCYVLETVLLKPANHYNVSYLVEQFFNKKRLHVMSLKQSKYQGKSTTELKDVANADEGKIENTCNTKHKQTQSNEQARKEEQTPSKTDVKEKDWREYYLRLPIESKRKEYKCGLNFVSLNKIPTWVEHAGEYCTKYDMKDVESKYEVNDELNQKVSLWQGNITHLEIDAIANAANSSLLGGGGVDGAIHSAAGNNLQVECAKLKHCDTGDAVLTGGYRLPAKYVIHTVGPIGEQQDKLASCYKKCLNIAKEKNIKTIAFPCISTGIYGYDVNKATPVALQNVREWLLTDNNKMMIDRIIFCVFKANFGVYEKNLLQFFPIQMPKNEEDKEPLEVTKPVNGERGRKDSTNNEAKKNELGVKNEPINNPITDDMNCKTQDKEVKIEEIKLKIPLPDANTNRQNEVKFKGNETVEDNHLLPLNTKKHGEDSPQKSEGKTVDESVKEPDDHSPAAKKKPPYPEPSELNADIPKDETTKNIISSNL